MAGRRTAGRILVIGATGNVGRHVVRELLDAGPAVRALSRSLAPGGLPDDVEHVHADLLALNSVDVALDGVDAVFLVWPFLDASRAGPLVEAVSRRARRIVYLSAAAVRDEADQQAGSVWADVEHFI